MQISLLIPYIIFVVCYTALNICIPYLLGYSKSMWQRRKPIKWVWANKFVIRQTTYYVVEGRKEPLKEVRYHIADDYTDEFGFHVNGFYLGKFMLDSSIEWKLL